MTSKIFITALLINAVMMVLIVAIPSIILGVCVVSPFILLGYITLKFLRYKNIQKKRNHEKIHFIK